MKIFLQMIPPTTTAQERKYTVVRGEVYIYKPKKLRDAYHTLMWHLKRSKPPEPFKGPVKLRVRWLFPKGKSHKHMEWRVSRPDTDNLEKMLKDCMTECGYWLDDAQVVHEDVCKIWSDAPTGIEIEITQLDKFAKEGVDSG